jgi:hypothetical protein
MPSFSIVCYGLLLATIQRSRRGGERSRLVYLALRGAHGLLSILDLFRHLGGFAFPPLSNLFVAILLYFVYTAITHPRTHGTQGIHGAAPGEGPPDLCRVHTLFVA